MPRRKKARKTPRRAVRGTARKSAKKRAKAARRPARVARRTAKRTARKRQARPVARKTKRPARAARPASAAPVRRAKAATRTKGRDKEAPRQEPILNRIRRLLADEERLGGAAAALEGDHLNASAVSGRSALRAELSRHTEGGPALTAGDLDAKWQDAYAVGDEAPGGDNPTPDQDRVDDIGKALGIQYQDGQELKGGDEVVERDRHRWELDPASSDDWPHGKK
jgi:hypothetical protein